MTEPRDLPDSPAPPAESVPAPPPAGNYAPEPDAAAHRPHATVPAADAPTSGRGVAPPAEELPPMVTTGPDAAPATMTVPRRVPSSRTGGLWVGITVAAVILLLLLIFILENNDTVDVAYFGQHGHLPLGVALLLAAVFGMLVVAAAGYGRIIQLRRAATHPDRKTKPARRRLRR
jgi:uncharacterized integral membrane protein